MHVWSRLSAKKWSDAWEARLNGLPGIHLVITAIPGRPTVRIEAYCEQRKQAMAIQQAFGGSIRSLKKQNWAAMAEPPSDPIRVRNRLVIIGQRDERARKRVARQFSGREVLSVPPEMAFGTGHHATTATVLRFIADAADGWRREGREWTMIDLGCGSGILAMAARKLGAASAWACDFDPDAVRVANDNIRRNKIEGLSAEVADVTRWKPTTRHDCVVANIFFDILVDIFPKLVRSVKRDGIVLISGILATQAGECLASGRRAGLVFDRIVRKGKWVSARGRLAQPVSKARAKPRR